MHLFGDIYRGKTVFLTGHTGFKGTWLSVWLQMLGANVVGYALDPETKPNMFELLGLPSRMTDIRGDILDYEKLLLVLERHQPDMVFHLAAQALVRESYVHPRDTYNTNLMGTVNVMEATLRTSSVQACVVITTDKVYKNVEWNWAYRENDRLGGHDAYAASKACAELAVASYQTINFQNAAGYDKYIPIVAARAGNVIGGGDWSKDRVIVDTVNSIAQNRNIVLRNPTAVRPWQHVMDALSGYLWLGYLICKDPQQYANAWNFGPSETRMITVREIVEYMLSRWQTSSTEIQCETDTKGFESHTLKLDSARANNLLNWYPCWDVHQALDAVIDWYKAYQSQESDLYELTTTQINQFVEYAQQLNRAWAYI